MNEWKDNDDWVDAFKYGENIRSNPKGSANTSPVHIQDVTKVIAMSEGENDGDSWIMAGKLKDGRYFFLSAGCDYTGWDCHANGDVMVADSKRDLIRYCLTDDDRARLDLTLI